MGYSWSELEDIFQNALKMPASEREIYVKNHANDNQRLEQTVLMMLRDAENADQYFDKLQKGIADGLEEKQEDIYQAGDKIDKYKIIEPIGRGGMGQVFLAERNDRQFEQKVAIKCFSADEVKDNFFENFRNEQQFLANLNHAAIAHILDGGVTDEGIHYIIMEYVDGLPVNEYLKSSSLNTGERLQLFIKICDAINYAHNRLILHLDIKPSNILINEEGHVKLLDFGIAQKIGNRLQKQVQKATPFYAAPEQLKLGDITIATDIFQLGILLHIIISAENPLKPSEDNPYDRKVKLSQSIDQELLAIINVCLSESSECRYVSVSALIEDVKNYLNKFPVKVYSKKWSYRAKKFTDRNKIKITLSALLVISLLSGLIISSYQSKIAQENEQKALKTSEFLLDIFRNADPVQTEGGLTVKDILDNSSKSVELKFDDKEFKLDLYDRLINIYTNVYLWNDSKKLAEKVLRDYKDINTKSKLNIMSTLAGNYRELSEYQKADSVFGLLLSKIQDPKENLPLDFKIENILALAKSQQIQGKYDSALHFIHQANSLINDDMFDKDKADIFNHYASVYKDLSKLDTAAFYQKNAIRILEAHHTPEHQTALAVYYNNQGNLFKDMSLYDSAIASFEHSLSLKRKIASKANLDIAITYSNLGGVHYKKKNYDSASSYLNRAIEIFSTQLEPSNNFIISTRYSLANIYYNQRNFQKALFEYQEVLAADTANFGLDHPYIADDYISLSNCYIGLKQMDKAFGLLKKAEGIIEAKFDKSHQKTSYLYNKFGQFYEEQKNYAMAQMYFQESYTLVEQYLGEDHRYTKLYKKDVERITKLMIGKIENL
ncbi:protein kinase domain-containing protein [Marivirga harenae]|uniref:serine/threonine-protein kinase n=1 Tax=Marivirga harenae TaxID=2010992 RepID=UPI0026E09881|nr:serine/threonine-protein kinase [Marivirga harenae]WKV13542.1 serine/threonine-protein kinase [Marivirga harenae]